MYPVKHRHVKEAVTTDRLARRDRLGKTKSSASNARHEELGRRRVTLTARRENNRKLCTVIVEYALAITKCRPSQILETC